MSQPPISPSARAACEQVIALMADYLNGDLDPNLHGRFERHLENCQECRAFVNTYRQTIRLTHILAYDEMPPDVQDRLLQLVYERAWAPISTDTSAITHQE